MSRRGAGGGFVGGGGLVCSGTNDPAKRAQLEIEDLLVTLGSIVRSLCAKGTNVVVNDKTQEGPALCTVVYRILTHRVVHTALSPRDRLALVFNYVKAYEQLMPPYLIETVVTLGKVETAAGRCKAMVRLACNQVQIAQFFIAYHRLVSEVDAFSTVHMYSPLSFVLSPHAMRGAVGLLRALQNTSFAFSIEDPALDGLQPAQPLQATPQPTNPPQQVNDGYSNGKEQASVVNSNNNDNDNDDSRPPAVSHQPDQHAPHHSASGGGGGGGGAQQDAVLSGAHAGIKVRPKKTKKSNKPRPAEDAATGVAVGPSPPSSPSPMHGDAVADGGAKREERRSRVEHEPLVSSQQGAAVAVAVAAQPEEEQRRDTPLRVEPVAPAEGEEGKEEKEKKREEVVQGQSSAVRPAQDGGPQPGSHPQQQEQQQQGDEQVAKAAEGRVARPVSLLSSQLAAPRKHSSNSSNSGGNSDGLRTGSGSNFSLGEAIAQQMASDGRRAVGGREEEGKGGEEAGMQGVRKLSAPPLRSGGPGVAIDRDRMKYLKALKFRPHSISDAAGGGGVADPRLPPSLPGSYGRVESVGVDELLQQAAAAAREEEASEGGDGSEEGKGEGGRRGGEEEEGGEGGMLGGGLNLLQHIDGDYVGSLGGAGEGVVVGRADSGGGGRGSFSQEFESKHERLPAVSVSDIRMHYTIHTVPHALPASFHCSQCSRRVQLPDKEGKRKKAVLFCHFTNRLFCDQCHHRSKRVLPGPVVQMWDFAKFEVCDLADQYLGDVCAQPSVELKSPNKAVVAQHKTFARMLKYRGRLARQRPFVLSCNDNASLLPVLEGRMYLLTAEEYVYSLEDLVLAHKGKFVPLLKSVFLVWSKHITVECEACRGRGSFCEAGRKGSCVCDPEETLFPFQNDRCSRCDKCKALYHRKCFKGACVRCDEEANDEIASVGSDASEASDK